MRMGPAELVQAAAMARRFYLEGKSKIQIAEEFGVSRFKVARVLETALERDLVKIEIRVPAELDAERSDALRARYGLRHAVVVESPADAEETPDPENLGEVAADLLGELVNEGDVLGLAWGRSTIHMAAALDRLPPCTVVQLTGVYDAGTAERGSVEAVRRAAQVSGGDAHPIYAPMLLPDAATAQGFGAAQDGPGRRVFVEVASPRRPAGRTPARGGGECPRRRAYDALVVPPRCAGLFVLRPPGARGAGAVGSRPSGQLTARGVRRARKAAACPGGLGRHAGRRRRRPRKPAVRGRSRAERPSRTGDGGGAGGGGQQGAGAAALVVPGGGRVALARAGAGCWAGGGRAAPRCAWRGGLVVVGRRRRGRWRGGRAGPAGVASGSRVRVSARFLVAGRCGPC
ncbi:hypothetical protein SVIOM342S_02417 [Streptomyces violaceorubidus]